MLQLLCFYLIDGTCKNRPDSLSIWVHGYSAEAYADHTHRVFWMGKHLNVNTEPIRHLDKRLAAKVEAGEDPVDVLWEFQEKFHCASREDMMALAKDLKEST